MKRFQSIISGIIVVSIILSLGNVSLAWSSVEPERIIESFENYGTDETAQLSEWSADAGSFKLYSEAYKGMYSAVFTSTGAYASQSKQGYNMDMTGYERIRIQVKNPSTPVTLRLQLQTVDGSSWYLDKQIKTGTVLSTMDYPLRNFAERWTGSTYYNPDSIDPNLRKLHSLTLVFVESSSPRSIIVDHIALVNGDPLSVSEIMVDGFENYGTDTTMQLAGWAAEAGTLKLDTESYGGRYSANFTSTGSYANHSKSNYNIDMTGYDRLRVYAMNTGTPLTLRMQITTYDNNVWYLDKIIAETSDFAAVDYLLTDFTERWSGSPQYDPNSINSDKRILKGITLVFVESTAPKTVKLDNISLATNQPVVAPRFLIDGFETYGSNTSVQLAGWGGENSTLKLDAEAYNGSYSAVLASTGAYPYQSKQGYDIDMTGYDRFRIYVKNPGAPATLRLQIVTADNNTWYLDKLVDTTNKLMPFDYPLAEFLERWTNSSVYNPNTSNASQRKLSAIYLVIVEGAYPKSIKIDDLQLTNPNTPLDPMKCIDDFESYGTSTTAQLEGWNGGESTMMLSTDAYKGSYSAAFTSTGSYGYQTKQGYNTDMTGYDRFRIYIKNPGVYHLTLRMQIQTADGNAWYLDKYVPASQTDFVQVDYSLEEFVERWTGTLPYLLNTTNPNQRVLSSLTIIYVESEYPNTILIDRISLANADAPINPSKLIDNFETYGSNTSAQLANWSASNGTLKLDTESHTGTYSANFTSTGVYANHSKIGYTVNMTGYESIRLYARNSGAPITLRIQISTEDGATWYLDKLITTNSTFTEVDYPLADFTERWSGNMQYKKNTTNKQRRTLSGITLVYVESTYPRTVKIDNIELIDKDINAKDQFYIASNFAFPGSGDRVMYETIAQETKNAGFNLIEITNINTDIPDVEGPSVNGVRTVIGTALESCEKFDLKAMVADPYMGGFQTIYRSIQEKHIKAGLEFYNRYSKALRGYIVWDEPYKAQNMIISQRMAWHQKSDLSSTLFVNLFPSYVPEYTWSNGQYPGYVNDFITAANPTMLSQDYYVFGNNTDCNPVITGNNVGLWRDWGFFRKRSLETGKPFWTYIQGIGDYVDKNVGNMTIERIRFQMYSALAYGAKYLSYYTSYGLVLDVNGNETDMYTSIKNLNNEVKVMGQYLYNKHSESIYFAGATSTQRTNYNLDNLSSSTLIQSIPANTIVSTFTDSSNAKYIFITNRTYNSSVTGNVVLKTSKHISKLNAANGAIDLVSTVGTQLPVNLSAGSGVLYVVK